MVEAMRSADGAWWWRCEDGTGAVVATSDAPRFPTRSDAESWVGEFWSDLADEGVAAVTLFEADREVYGPMSLEA